MTNVDQFESVFRSAAKERFRYEPIELTSILVITDLEEYEANLFGERVKQFLSVLPEGPRITWEIVPGERFRTVPELLGVVESSRPDLICTYRNLRSEGWKWPFTLGDHLEVLTQATTTPVMVMPHPRAGAALDHAMGDTREVMAITDHLTGDDGLVNNAVHFVEPGGTLFLTHVEDEATYRRFIDVIGRISELDTDVARERIREQLMKEPHDYIRSCHEGLVEAGVDVKIEEVIVLGHHLREYRELIASRSIDLLVFNTKDEDQLAMHGLAYPLAIELREIPLLML